MKALRHLKHPVTKFLFIFAGLYILWFMFYDLWLHPMGTLDENVVFFSMIVSQHILEMMGFIVYNDGLRTIGIEGTSGLWIGDACNAVVLMALYCGFILAFPGKLKPRVLFLVIGSAAILLLNILRIVFLAIIDTYSREWTEFNHTYTFTLIIYGFIFYLWYLWVKRAPRDISPQE